MNLQRFSWTQCCNSRTLVFILYSTAEMASNYCTRIHARIHGTLSIRGNVDCECKFFFPSIVHYISLNKQESNSTQFNYWWFLGIECHFQSAYAVFVCDLRPPEDGNHLPKHVRVNLEYINKSTSSLTHLLVILQRYNEPKRLLQQMLQHVFVETTPLDSYVYVKIYKCITSQ
jgi:hypothetical protein